MVAKELIAEPITPVSEGETARQISERLSDLKLAHLPVVGGSEYLGLVGESEIGSLADPDGPFDIKNVGLPNVCVTEDQHIYEVIDLAARYKLTLIPVVRNTREYIGSITLPMLVRNISNITAAGQPGAILVLSMAPQDYSPAILARIIEENNAKIISMYMVRDVNSPEVTVTIKINSEETGSIMRSFDRYGYSVKSYFMANSELEDFYRSRYEEFMKYMNI